MKENVELVTETKMKSVNNKLKKLIVVPFLALLCSTNIFAANGEVLSIGALDTLGDVLVGALGSTWLKAILATALVIEFGVAAWGQSKGASELVSGAVKWMFATGGMLGATGIANFIFNNVTVDELTLIPASVYIG